MGREVRAAVGASLIACVASAAVAFWVIGDRFGDTCRPDVPEHCGFWGAPQRWNPGTVQLIGIVAACAALVCVWSIAMARRAGLVSSQFMRSVWLFIGAGAAMGACLRVLSARVDDDGNLTPVVAIPLLLVAAAMIVRAARGVTARQT